ncbi:MAG: winged helix-turn-helix transcriptional regulator [Candidatus Methanoperedens sp.]|uniref:winged helix-turn-helix transcriptional regulator n=1 Tax=Candidatus Methanoperedens nitratireducens TaxID=1392998 RepID=UPI0019D6ADA8|nr:winged helix-turn-helix transcriptional regulator [Candidatus Methanoperedens nitroreducens]MDJ1420930.1 winged helix-turn-helix transcriptional regulator [Candidatus Methanoperedens sp.]
MLILPAIAANDDIIVESGYKVPARGERHDPVPVSWWQFQFLIIIGQISIMPVETLAAAKSLTYLGYKAITDNNILSNSTRLKILDYIKRNPGASFNVISKETGVNRGTLSYHLKILKMHKNIRPYKNRSYIKYFENPIKFSDDEKKVLQYLKQDASRRIIEVLIERPGASRKDLSNAIGISGPAVTQCIEYLQADGIVEIEKGGQFNKYYVSARAMQIMQNVLPK